MQLPELESPLPPIRAEEAGFSLKTFELKKGKNQSWHLTLRANVTTLTCHSDKEMLQCPQSRSQYKRTGLCAMSSVVIDSDLVVIVQAQLNQAAPGGRSLIASEQRSGM